MKTFIKSIFVHIALLISVFFLFSCGNPFMIKPNASEIDVQKKSIVAPETISVSHGDYRNISLTWTQVQNAKQYMIYAADSPFDTFKKIGETNGNVGEFKIYVPSGKDLWFRVSSISYSEEESALSSYVFGSSIAIPNITGVELGKDGTSATISWWMSNCKESTYKNKVSYKITCYEKDKVQVFDTKIADGKGEPVTFSGLQHKTTYYYQVEAFVGEYKHELSDYADAETARRTIPDAPEDVSSSKGIKPTPAGIEIGWTLPDGVDFKEASDIFAKHPLYFTIERKVFSDPDENYAILESYIGTRTDKGGIAFNCGSNATFGKLSVDLRGKTAADAIENYPDYVVGARLTYTDNTAESGKKYSYRIRSYADDTGNKTVSSDFSFSTCDGWLIPKPSIKADAAYEQDKDNMSKFTSITLKIDLDFEDFSLDGEGFYSYVLVSQRTPFATASNPSPSSDADSFVHLFKSRTEISSYKITYDSEALSDSAKHGYYAYKIYVCPKTVTGIPTSSAEYYIFTDYSSKFTLTNDASNLPEISTFEVKDGYATKFVIKWNYNASYKYVLGWTEYNGSTNQPLGNGEKKTLELNASDLDITTAPGFAIYKDSVQSGDARKYSLTAINSLQVTKEFDSISKTLGTANVTMKSLAYDSITVEWDAVQQAESYEVSAYYSDDPTKKNLVVSTAGVSNTKITENSGKCTCVITKPDGYNSAVKSGKDITLEVHAKNSKVASDNETKSVSSVQTFGPAKISARAGELYENNIFVIWSEIPGAAGYIISRVRYDDNQANTIGDGTDLYYLDAQSLVLKRNGEKPAEGSSVSKKNKEFWLNDIDDANVLDSSCVNQRKLSLGLPFGYVIIPVLEGDGDFDVNGLTISAGDANISYSDIKNSSAFLKTASLGYGLNVKAAKSENTQTISVSWDKPYNSQGIPYVYRRLKNDSAWKRVASLAVNDTSFNDKLEGQSDSEKALAYYYAVQYHKAAAGLSYKSSYKEHLSKMDDRYADLKNVEELNKGYLFYVDFSADYNGVIGTDGNFQKDERYYSQKVCHVPWDFNERARGPSKYVISAKNLNTAYDYIKLADISIDPDTKAETLTLNETGGIVNGDGGDTKLSASGSDLQISPVAMTNYLTGASSVKATSTEGLLKVLRSAKTFYKLESSVSYKLGDDDEKTVDLSQEVFAYRQITDDEFVRSVGLIIADALYQSGVPWSGTVTTWNSSKCDGYKGTFTLDAYVIVAWKGRSRWGFGNSDYQHLFRAGTSSLYNKDEYSTYISDFNIKAGTTSGNSGNSNGYKLFYLDPLELTVTPRDINDERLKRLDSFKGTIKFEAENSNKREYFLSIKKDGKQIVSVDNNEAEFFSYFPYKLGEYHKDGDATANSSFKTYQSPWWK
ncbi:MAG: hypothetical protein ACTTJG_03765 [Treponema sp.]